jgi:hypothetical protein
VQVRVFDGLTPNRPSARFQIVLGVLVVKIPSFAIFSGKPNKNACWLETVQGLANARDRMEEIAAEHPGEYFLFGQQVHAVLASTDTRPGAGLKSEAQPYAERRGQCRGPARYYLDASAEITSECAHVKTTAKVTELSLYGCCLDTSARLSAEKPVELRIFAYGEQFEARARIIYANPTLGMGLAFLYLEARSLATLKKWLVLALPTCS